MKFITSCHHIYNQ